MCQIAMIFDPYAYHNRAEGMKRLLPTTVLAEGLREARTEGGTPGF